MCKWLLEGDLGVGGFEAVDESGPKLVVFGVRSADDVVATQLVLLSPFLQPIQYRIILG